MKKIIVYILLLFLLINSTLAIYEEDNPSLASSAAAPYCVGTTVQPLKNVTLDYVYFANNQTSGDKVQIYIDSNIRTGGSGSYEVSYKNFTLTSNARNHTITGINLSFGVNYSIFSSSGTHNYVYNLSVSNRVLNNTNLRIWGDANGYLSGNDCRGDMEPTTQTAARQFIGFGTTELTYPSVKFNANTTLSGTYINNSLNSIYASVNVTNFPGFSNLSIYVYNSSGIYSSINTSGTNFSYNFTNLVFGTYNVYASAFNGTTYFNTSNITVIIYGLTLNITNPINTSQRVISSLNITYNYTLYYLNTTSINITYYNISLLNSDLSFNRTIKENNSNNLSYNWNNLSTLQGTFYILIKSTNSNNNTVNVTSNSIFISYNSLQIFFYNELNNSILTDNITVTLSSILNNYVNSSNTGNMTFINPINGTYTILASAINYNNKIYEIIILNDTIQIFNISLLSNITSVPITIILKDTLSRVIPDARVIISRAYSGNWVTISDSFSDDGGTILTSLQPGISHVVTIIANNFLVKNFVQIFESANSPYTFILSSTSGTVYTDIFNDVNISYSPLSSILQANSSYNFSLNALSTLGLLQWASINSSLNNTNMTGTVLVISTIININTSGLNTTYPVTYCVKQANFSQYCFIVNYYVEGRIMNNNSLENSFVKFKDNFTGNDTSWLSIMAIAAILCICIILTEISGGNITVATIGGFVGLIFFAFVGWLNIVLVGFLVIIGGVLFFFNKGGQV